jgi:hypothetical protein
MDAFWGQLLVGQLEFYWDTNLGPRLTGLTDEEYFWEPVDGCWSLRPDAEGRYALEQDWPEPSPAPVTTIAWRIVHLGAYCLANRANAYFPGAGPDRTRPSGTAPDDSGMFDRRYVPADLPGSAADGVAFLEHAYRHWRDGVAALDDDALRMPLGPKGENYAADPMAGLVLHISREVMHHGGEIGVLRDLYRAADPKSRGGGLGTGG